ncbi:MAG: hypothetical protein JW994_07365, partial [Candidatus Omnitrophica bacterium]|nr:hypothetical protein [Candidatus Omnitrophota bacterium]
MRKAKILVSVVIILALAVGPVYPQEIMVYTLPAGKVTLGQSAQSASFVGEEENGETLSDILFRQTWFSPRVSYISIPDTASGFLNGAYLRGPVAPQPAQVELPAIEDSMNVKLLPKELWFIIEARKKIKEHTGNIESIYGKSEEKNAAAERLSQVCAEYNELFAQLPEGHPFEKLVFYFPTLYIPVREAIEKSKNEIDILRKAIEEHDYKTIKEHLGINIGEVPIALQGLTMLINLYNAHTNKAIAEITAIKEYLKNYELIKEAEKKIKEHTDNIESIYGKSEERDAAAERFGQLYAEYEELFAQLPPDSPFDKLLFPFPNLYVPIREAIEKSKNEIDILRKAIEELDYETIKEHLGIDIEEVQKAIEGLNLFINMYNRYSDITMAEMAAIKEYIEHYELIKKVKEAAIKDFAGRVGVACDDPRIFLNKFKEIEGTYYVDLKFNDLQYSYPTSAEGYYTIQIINEKIAIREIEYNSNYEKYVVKMDYNDYGILVSRVTQGEKIGYDAFGNRYVKERYVTEATYIDQYGNVWGERTEGELFGPDGQLIGTYVILSDYEYNASGILIREVRRYNEMDPQGCIIEDRCVEFRYNDNGVLILRTEGGGKYDSEGRMIAYYFNESIYNDNGILIIYTEAEYNYNPVTGNLIDRYYRVCQYNDYGILISRFEIGDKYDSEGRSIESYFKVTTEIDDYGVIRAEIIYITKCKYDSQGNWILLEVFDTTYNYNEYGILVSSITQGEKYGLNGMVTEQYITTSVYNDYGILVSRVTQGEKIGYDAFGNQYIKERYTTTATEIDGYGNVLKEWTEGELFGPYGQLTGTYIAVFKYEYNASGTLIKEGKHFNEMDLQGRLIKNYGMEFIYNDNGVLVEYNEGGENYNPATGEYIDHYHIVCQYNDYGILISRTEGGEKFDWEGRMIEHYYKVATEIDDYGV